MNLLRESGSAGGLPSAEPRCSQANRSVEPPASGIQILNPLDQAGWSEVQRVAHELLPLAAADLRYCSPAPRSRATGEGLGYAPLVQLALSPQCGFSSTVHGNNIAVEAQRAKLRLVIETAQEVWK